MDIDDMNKVIAAIRIAIVKATADIKLHAVRHCPVDTGRLRASIESENTDDKIIIRANTEYDKYVEFGTIRQSPQPFIRPAIHAGVRKYIPERIKAELGRIA